MSSYDRQDILRNASYHLMNGRLGYTDRQDPLSKPLVPPEKIDENDDNTDVLGAIDLPWQEIYTLVTKIIARSVIGAVCEFEAIDKNGVKHTEHIINKDGKLDEEA